LPVELNQDVLYTFGMSNFLRGMSSVGQLFPAAPSYSDYPSMNSAWQGVANSFHQAGKNIHIALKEFADAQRESKQTS
jgi:hypothetical protein